MASDTAYKFSYLRERNKYLRLDVILLYFTIPSYIYYFEMRVFDSEDLAANFSLMGLCSFHMLLFFMPFWSNAIMATFQYSSCGDIEHATHVYCRAENKKQHTVSTEITPV